MDNNMGAYCLQILLPTSWYLVLQLFLLHSLFCLPNSTSAEVDLMSRSAECSMTFKHPEELPQILKVGNYPLPSHWFGCYLSTNNTQKSCTLNINKVFKSVNVQEGLSIFTFDLVCLSPMRVLFHRTNITKSLFLSRLVVSGPCEISGKDLAVWGQATGLQSLYLINEVFVREEENQTTFDFDGLFNLLEVRMDSLSSHGIPSMFTSFNWTKITQFHIKNMSLTSIPNILKQTMPNLQLLYLADNRFTKPPSFPWCTASIKLPKISFDPSNWNSRLSYVKEQEYKKDVFERSFYIEFNPDLDVSNYEFIHGSLDKISLRGNDLKIISPTIFYKVDLQGIDLSLNKFRKIPAQVFSKANSLTNVNLAGNYLEFIDNETFRELRQLRKLDVSCNYIHTLPSGLLSYLENLEEIHLQNNSLENIEPGALTNGLNSLNKIYLQRNNLRRIPKSVFLLQNLKLLDMSDNIVTFQSFVETVNSLDIKTFKSIHNLSRTEKPVERHFNLSRNKIKLPSEIQSNYTISSNLYWTLVAYTINLTGNPLICDCLVSGFKNTLNSWTTDERTRIDTAQFDTWVCHSPEHLRGKKLLSVRSELLKCEIYSRKCPPGCKCYERVSSLPILVDCRNGGLTKVPNEVPESPAVELRLEFNQIHRLTFHDSLRNVTVLNISHNILRHITPAFPISLKLNEIYLDSNQLTALPKDFEKMNLLKIDIQNNLFECNCKNKWMKTWFLGLGDALTGGAQTVSCSSMKYTTKWLNSMKDDEFICSFNSSECFSPAALLVVRQSTDFEQLKCEPPYLRCPARCMCDYRTSDLPISVNCLNRNLTEVPYDVTGASVELHLEYNNIQNFTFRSSLQNVTSLYLSHNNLRYITSNSLFSWKLNKIFLNSNQLTTLPKEFRSLNLTRIDIRNNTFECKCENKWIKEWLQQLHVNGSLDGGIESVTCSSGEKLGKPLAFVADADFMCSSINTNKTERVEETKLLVTPVAYILGGLLFIFIILVFIYRFRGDIKLIIFMRFRWHPFDRVDDSEPSKIYDAFVSYSSNDLHWVMHILRENLENEHPPYRLCIHHRDFLVGAPIFQNIFDSVETSRRMIMVLSKNFIQSEWCMMEFRAAHQKVMRDRTNYLIIVLFDDVDIKDLDNELKMYLRTNTYLDIHNKWFWEKLKYALPQKRSPDTATEQNAPCENNETSL